MPKCKLCLKAEADKKNSHIIPKFMGERLFEAKPRHGIQIDITGKQSKIQSIPKEDFIFCSNCEKRFERLETYFARKLTSIHNYTNEKDKFKVHSGGVNSILECFKVSYNALKLFNYSLVWRASISNHFLFEKYKLPESYEEKLRGILDANLFISHSGLINNFNEIQDDTGLDSYFFKCKVKNEFSRGPFSTYQIGENAFGLFLVDFIVYTYTNKQSIPKEFDIISDIQDENALIVMASVENWREINNESIKDFKEVIAKQPNTQK
ncbi:hypothetical protein OOZ15_13980 [Galbibacter sp. EGI 63066]|uniref:hypothetical protein n=1 Tax=Galbibacter sp. EGI 63066 TaxID=2993559 RepID=UPI0022493933|nr:hypothetical protein [Galbibacter sp. EGI 63066]MCX2681057.1 hypothetical protein [Galbibacter sp. EGI 63066]